MVVRIRLSRFGNKHQPFYNIVVAQARYVAPARPFCFGVPGLELDLDYSDLCPLAMKEADENN